MNDVTETEAFKRAFGEEGAKRIRISSTKSMTGHMLGAAGAIEAIASVLALREGVIPPTIHLHAPGSRLATLTTRRTRRRKPRSTPRSPPPSASAGTTPALHSKGSETVIRAKKLIYCGTGGRSPQKGKPPPAEDKIMNRNELEAILPHRGRMLLLDSAELVTENGVQVSRAKKPSGRTNSFSTDIFRGTRSFPASFSAKFSPSPPAFSCREWAGRM